MSLSNQVEQMDAMVAKGDIVNAVRQYFAENATTSDYGGTETRNKAQMIAKMEQFVGAIARVNDITHHRTIANGHLSASEFTFDFDMKDGSKIQWHEIIRRIWNDAGQVVQEEYFQA